MIDVVGAGDGAVRERHRRDRRWGRLRRAAGDPPGRRVGRPVLQRHVRQVVPRGRVHRRRQRRDAHPHQPVRRRGVVDLTFATESGEAKPTAFQGFTILPAVGARYPDAPSSGARDEEVIAVQVATDEWAASWSAAPSTTSAADDSATRSRSPRRRCATSSGSPTARRAGDHRDVSDLQPDRLRRPGRRRLPRAAARLGVQRHHDRRSAHQVVVFDPAAEETWDHAARRASRRGVLDARRPVDRRRTGADPSGGRLGGHDRGRSEHRRGSTATSPRGGTSASARLSRRRPRSSSTTSTTSTARSRSKRSARTDRRPWRA